MRRLSTTTSQAICSKLKSSRFQGNQRQLLLIGFHRGMASSTRALAARLEKVAARLRRMLESGGAVRAKTEAQAFLDDLEEDESIKVEEVEGAGRCVAGTDSRRTHSGRGLLQAGSQSPRGLQGASASPSRRPRTRTRQTGRRIGEGHHFYRVDRDAGLSARPPRRERTCGSRQGHAIPWK